MLNNGSGSDLRRELNFFDSTMINVGSVIASAIFIVPAAVAAHLGSAPLILVVWIFGGVISLFGAVAIAELGAMMPRAGGQYIYLAGIYGPLGGFLYGWTAFFVIMSASISAVAVVFATYLGHFFDLDAAGIKLVAILSIVLLTVINCFGIKLGALVQNGFTLLKMVALAFLVLVCFLAGRGMTSGVTPELPAIDFLSPGAALVLAMIAVLWAYDGWIEITFIAGEVKNPEKNIHRSLIVAVIIVIAAYLLINLGYMAVLSIEQMAVSSVVASDAAAAALGPAGAAFVAAAVAVSTFGANNGFIITGARIYYAMSKQGLFFRSFGWVHPEFKTPVYSLLGQGVVASLLVLSGTYEELFTYVVFASWLFYAMSCLGVIILRRREPDRDRPYKTWGYPFTPVVFIVFAVILIVSAVAEAPRESLIGAGMILLGVPVYYYWSTRREKTAEDN